MQIKDLLKDPETQEELSLDTQVYCTTTTCCDTEYVETRLYVEDDKLFIDYHIGSCRQFGNLSACKNSELLSLFSRHLAEILTAEQQANLLTHPNKQLRELVTSLLRRASPEHTPI